MTDRPKTHRLHLGCVSLPESHPRAADGTCEIYGFALSTPDGLVLVDSGTQEGHPLIDELYSPSVISIIDALHQADLDERDVIAIVNTHLHFDHCGQNHMFPQAPVWVTEAELLASRHEFYTVPEWASIEDSRLRLSSDFELVAPGVRLVHSPGHTPGHQSVVIDGDNTTEIIVGQACYRCAEFELGKVAITDMHDEDWIEAGRESLARLRSLDPTYAYFSHDPVRYKRPKES